MRIRIFLFTILLFMCASCSNPLISAAQLVYDRQSIKERIDNHQIQVKANHTLFERYPHLRKANISLVTFNRDLIAFGQVPTNQDKDIVTKTLKPLKGPRRFFNELTVGPNASVLQNIKDSWLTTKLRTKMIAENGVDPSLFKIVCEKNVVYILGDVKKAQAHKVIGLAKQLSGADKIVKIIRYYEFSDPTTKV